VRGAYKGRDEAGKRALSYTLVEIMLDNTNNMWYNNTRRKYIVLIRRNYGQGTRAIL
jgi:hypothetical protein